MILLPDGTPYTGPVAKSAPKPDPYLLRALIGSGLYWRLSDEMRHEVDRAISEAFSQRKGEP